MTLIKKLFLTSLISLIVGGSIHGLSGIDKKINVLNSSEASVVPLESLVENDLEIKQEETEGLDNSVDNVESPEQEEPEKALVEEDVDVSSGTEIITLDIQQDQPTKEIVLDILVSSPPADIEETATLSTQSENKESLESSDVIVQTQESESEESKQELQQPSNPISEEVNIKQEEVPQTDTKSEENEKLLQEDSASSITKDQPSSSPKDSNLEEEKSAEISLTSSKLEESPNSKGENETTLEPQKDSLSPVSSNSTLPKEPVVPEVKAKEFEKKELNTSGGKSSKNAGNSTGFSILDFLGAKNGGEITMQKLKSGRSKFRGGGLRSMRDRRIYVILMKDLNELKKLSAEKFRVH